MPEEKEVSITRQAKSEKRDVDEVLIRETLLRLFSYLLRHRTLLIVAIVFLMLTGGVEAYFVKAVDDILKNGFLNGDDWFIRWSGLLLVAVLGARALSGYIGNYAMAKTGRSVIFELRQDRGVG